jgi:hypothetical protein
MAVLVSAVHCRPSAVLQFAVFTETPFLKAQCAKAASLIRLKLGQQTEWGKDRHLSLHLVLLLH